MKNNHWFGKLLPERGQKLVGQVYSDFRNIFSRWQQSISPMPRFGFKRVIPKLFERNRDFRYDIFLWAAQYLSANRIDGVYTDFGCAGGNTMRYALNTFGNPHGRGLQNQIEHFYAFDSFGGLPEPKGIDRQKSFEKGKFAMSESFFKSIMKRDLHRLTVVKGLYEDVLPKCPWPTKHKIAFAYIDCDYYASTVQVLDFVKDKMAHGGIIAFDDWQMYYGDPKRGQKLAFEEFCSRVEDLHFEPYLPFPFMGMSYICLHKALIGKSIN